jgi:hypothetical protein
MEGSLRFVVVALAPVLSACASNQEAMLKQSPLMQMSSPKRPGEVAGCVAQRLNASPLMGTDGTNFWVTRSSAAGVVVRYDFKPAASGEGTVVEYRSRLRINNGLDKVRSCLL